MSSSVGGIRSSAVSTLSAPPTATWNSCTPISSRRRSMMSASAPAGSANSSIGSVVATCTSATSAVESGVSTRIHCAPTVCIQVPSMLPSWANHSTRNAPMRSGAHGDSLDPATAARAVSLTG